jgi:hypothetical protein
MAPQSMTKKSITTKATSVQNRSEGPKVVLERLKEAIDKAKAFEKKRNIDNVITNSGSLAHIPSKKKVKTP